MVYDVIIVGAGIIGGMLARELSRYQLSVCLLEKENDVAMGATKANSGIIHGGYDPVPGTLKAQLNTQGVELLFQAARELNVPVKRNGSLVCAFGTTAEHELLDELCQRGRRNQIPSLKLLSGDEARKIEPALSRDVSRALHVPNAGIICPYSLTIAAVGNAMDNGVTLRRNFKVCAIEKTNHFTLTDARDQTAACRFLINCAGGYAHEIAALAGDPCLTIIHRAGEYLLLDKRQGNKITHTIFQCPTSAGKGILVAPTVHGNLLTGPTAGKVPTPDSNDTTAQGMDQVRALAAKSVPSIDFSQTITSFTGVRATDTTGDFLLEASKAVPGLIHAGAIDSPGLTCCVSIAKYLVDVLKNEGLVLTEKPNWNPHRPNAHAFSQLSDSKKNEIIRKDPAYGKIVCRCEQITEGEILEALRTQPVALDMDGVKRRTRCGMGRCQGGFCGPLVMALISRECGIPMEQVTKCGQASHYVTERIGDG